LYGQAKVQARGFIDRVTDEVVGNVLEFLVELFKVGFAVFEGCFLPGTDFEAPVLGVNPEAVVFITGEDKIQVIFNLGDLNILFVEEGGGFRDEIFDAVNAFFGAAWVFIDEFIDILKSGNLDDLTKYRDEFINSKNAIFHSRFEALLDQWEHSINLPSKVSASDLRVVYSYLFSTEIAPTKFGRILAAKNIKIQVGLINGKTTRYIEIIWKSNLLTQQGPTTCRAGATVN
jgi:hypothetical protein